jgi:hypothetical protein
MPAIVNLGREIALVTGIDRTNLTTRRGTSYNNISVQKWT